MCVALKWLMLLVVAWVWTLSFGLTASADIVNLALGGDFEDKEDLTEWMLRNEDGSKAEMKIDKTAAAIGRSSLFFEIAELSGTDGTRPRIGQVQAIANGKTYTLSAFYKAEEERTASITVQLNAGPWTRFVEKTITIGTEWQEQWASFTAPQDAEVTIQPTRNTGSDTNYWLDGIRFFEGEYEPYSPDQAVSGAGKIATGWGAVKTLY